MSSLLLSMAAGENEDLMVLKRAPVVSNKISIATGSAFRAGERVGIRPSTGESRAALRPGLRGVRHLLVFERALR